MGNVVCGVHAQRAAFCRRFASTFAAFASAFASVAGYAPDDLRFLSS